MYVNCITDLVAAISHLNTCKHFVLTDSFFLFCLIVSFYVYSIK